MLADHSAPRQYTLSWSDSLTNCSSKGAVFSRPLSTQALRPLPIGFTYELRQRRRAVLAGHFAPKHYTSSWLDLLTCCSSEGGQC